MASTEEGGGGVEMAACGLCQVANESFPFPSSQRAEARVTEALKQKGEISQNEFQKHAR